MIGIAAGMEMADMAWEVRCREEDMKQRALENERHAIDDARRAVDEKAAQLKVLANQSALFAGFVMVALVESSVPEDINGMLLAFYGGVTALVVALMLVSTLNSTYMLVAILRYDCVRRDVPFEEFWKKRCEPDWKLALRAFSFGVPLFMVDVALVAWLTFWESDGWIYSSSVVTTIAAAATCFWFVRTERKWGGFLLKSEARLITRGSSMLSRNNSAGSGLGASSQGRAGKINNSGRAGDDVSEVLSLKSLDLSTIGVGDLTKSEKKLNGT